MEIRLSVVLLGILLLLSSAMSASEPVAVEIVEAGEATSLALLEDGVAHERGNLELTRDLTTAYLHMGKPGLVIATVRTAPPALTRDPLLTHRLAQAYEASGRVEDAFATAQLAHARCLCSFGHAEQASALRGASEMCTNIPRCTGSTLAALEMHEEALSMLAQWGVADPRRDGRTGLAYKLARRTARIASLGLVETETQ